MTPDILCDSLHLTLPALYECAPAPHGAVRVRTPLMYPDGGAVDVFVLERDAGYVITDHGDAIGWLGMQSSSVRLSKKQRSLVDDVCETQGLEFDRGRLVTRCDGIVPVADAIERVALGVVRVCDIWFTFRSHASESVADEVDDWLRHRQFNFERQVKSRGRSSREWTIDYRVTAASRTSLVFLLTTGSRNAARRIAEHVLAGCVDLNHLRSDQPELAFVSLFDDTGDVWRAEDFALVEQHSEIAYWSRPDQVEQILMPS